MSTPADLRSQVNGISYLAMASYSIFYYDFVLTFGEEVEYFWRPKLGVVSLFFLVNRYLSFFGIIPLYLGEFRDWSIESCRAFETFNSFFAVAVQIVVGALMVMRTYALYDRSGKILLFLCAVVIIGITLACWSILSGETSPDSSIKTPAAPGCITALTDDDAHRLVLAWGCLVVFDTLIFFLTLHKTVKLWKMGESRLINILLWDGVLYYLVLLAANLSNILTFLCTPPLVKGANTSLANVLSATLMSRLMINVRSPSIYGTTRRSHTLTNTNLGPFEVSTVIEPGTFGGTISHYEFYDPGRGEMFEHQVRGEEIELQERAAI